MRDDQTTAEYVTVLPGQVWLIEHGPESPLSAQDSDALVQANVVLYDRALAPLVAEVLPLGSYGEPLPYAAGPYAAGPYAAGGTLSPRASALAAEGWSVVQLVAATSDRRARLHTCWPRTNGAVARSQAHAFTANGLAG
jgi:hypothetical protein